MDFQDELLLNKWGQDIIQIDDISNLFSTFNIEIKRKFLADISYLIIQSKPEIKDIEVAIHLSKVKPTSTSCILLKKNGIKHFSFEIIIQLPENETYKSLFLFLSLFKIAYKRRFENEKNSADKWWYWDLSNAENLIKLSKIYPI